MMEKDLKENPEEKLEEVSEVDLDMEPYFRAWAAYKQRLAKIPVPEVDLKKLKKWHRRSPRSKLLRREVAALLLSIAMLVFFLCQYKKGMAMPVPYIMTLLLCALCLADSLYALRLIALTNPLTASIPDMLTNCARLRLYKKIELLMSLVIVFPMAIIFIAPLSVWVFYSVNIYSDGIINTFSWTILLIVVLAAVLIGIYGYRNDLHLIKDSIKEIRENREFFKK